MTIHEDDGLRRLQRAIARDFELLNLPATNWVPARNGPDGKPLLDVLVVGGGMCGLTAAFSLRRLGVHNIRVIDAQSAGLEGPWRTYARMETLRSPKHLTGPAVGLPNLTFRAWYEAQHGGEAWEPLGYIPREMWADYLNWYGHVTDAAVENGLSLKGLAAVPIPNAAVDAGGGPIWQADLQRTARETEIVYARTVVLATGRDGLAVPRIPEPFAPFRGDGVDHTGDAPTRDKMRGRNVAIIGLGASAFDYAAEALEGGANHVRILGRSPELSRINKAKQLGYAGFVNGFPLLRDPEKVAIFEYIFRRGVPPPRSTVQRVMRHANVELVLGAPTTEVMRSAGGRLNLQTPRGAFEADRVVLGTGYFIDLDAPAYLAGFAAGIRRWRDALPEGTSGGELLDGPYLGQGFQFLPHGNSAPAGLEQVLCFNHAAMLSLGNLANDIPAVSEGADRLARHISAMLYLAERKTHLADLHGYEDPELLGDEIPGLKDWWPPM
ncbi:MAG: NAD(P)/FAD-dependent oxidoreductase [Hyphomicrobiaceae bacterium]